MVALRSFRHSGPSFSDLVPYAGIVANGVILLKDGSLMAGWYFAGPDSESSTDAERNDISRQINAILGRLGSGWMIQVDALRIPATDYAAREACHFADGVTRAIDEERRAHFGRERGHFESKHAMIVTWRPPERTRAGLTRYVYSDRDSRTAGFADIALQTFETAVRELEQYLSNVLSIARMRTQETEAYLGSLPGNWYANIRAPLISTRNLADLLPLNTVWAGHPTAPCPFYPAGSPPLLQVASGSTPFRLNLHVDDVGHTLIFGPTGSGKSTLLALIAAQFRRYAQSQIFAFDKGRSLYPLTLASGGDHHDVGADRKGQGTYLAFCPLLELASDGDRAWASEWIETLVTLQGVAITPDHRNAISRQIALMASAPGRSLSDFVSGVQMRELKDALHHYTIDGPMGHLLDAEADGLTLGAFQTFEIEELMNMGERSLVPVLTYLFRRIEKRLTGAPSLILLDEAWLMLGHPVFRDKIREWLKVLRKANCAVVLATQSISDAERSGIIDVLKESCPTKICLPNGAAREPGTREFYERIGFNERQIEIVATAIPKRDYYVTSPVGRRLFDMALGPVALAFVGASGRDHLKRIADLETAHGTTWPIRWLEERGIGDAEARLVQN